MEQDCANPVTHIGEKGYVYCAAHAPCRSGWERVRKMTGWERARIAAGKVLMSYAPITKEESDRREQERAKAAS